MKATTLYLVAFFALIAATAAKPAGVTPLSLPGSEA